MDKIAIVILNWNGKKMMEQYLASVVRYSSPMAVVYVADNASTDGSVEYLKAHFADVRLVLLDRNYGFAEGYNKALAQVEAEYYVLLNSDVEVTENWLVPLVEWMDAHPETAACQPKLLALADRGAFEYAGAAGGFVDRYGYPFCRGRIFDTVERDHGQYDAPEEVLWATGACLMVRAADYFGCGGLDGRFFAHNEEIDLCWRLGIMGRKVFCIPESHVFHLGGGTLPKGNPMKTFLNFRNNLTMLYKNLPESELTHVMWVRWVLDYVAALQTLLVNRNWGDCKAIFKARKAFRKWLPEFKADRERIQQMRQNGCEERRMPFSLLWQYHFRRRRTFGQLPKNASETES